MSKLATGWDGLAGVHFNQSVINGLRQTQREGEYMTMQPNTCRRIRRITSMAVATTFMTQNFAWAVCSDGLGFPAGQTSYVSALLPPDLSNMTPHVFTATGRSHFI